MVTINLREVYGRVCINFTCCTYYILANKVRQDPKYYNICEKFLKALPVDLPLEETTQKLTAMLEQYFCPGGLKNSNVHTDRVLMVCFQYLQLWSRLLEWRTSYQLIVTSYW